MVPGRVAQSVTCLATDACLTADPGVANSIPARSHTFMDIDHEIISTVILLPSADSFKKGCCQLQNRTEQNRTVSLLISGHIHDIEIQCEQQNVIYKGLGIFFSSKYKAVIQIWYVGLLSFISQRSVNR